MTVWVCGNSQSWALSRGLAAIADPGCDVQVFVLGNAKYELTDFSRIENGAVTVNVEEYAKSLKVSTGNPFFDKAHVWGFCQGTHNARIFRHKFWNNSDPSGVAVRRRRPVTQAILDAIIEADQKYIKQFHQHLRETGTRCFVVSCPPPRADHPCMQNGTRLETITFIDQRARTLMKDYLAKLEVSFIDFPPEAATPEGLLKPEFYAPDRPGVKDAHHANADYGLLMMRRVLDYLSSTGLGGEAGATRARRIVAGSNLPKKPQQNAEARSLDPADQIDQARKTAANAALSTLIFHAPNCRLEALRTVIAAGQKAFGETHVRHAKTKWPSLKSEFPDTELHLLGSLPVIHAREAVALFDVIHSLDRPKLAEALRDELARTGRRPLFFIQLNLLDGTLGPGIRPRNLPKFLNFCRETLNLPIFGLMGNPPAGRPLEPHLALLTSLAQQHGLGGISTGTNPDCETAIQYGATHACVSPGAFEERSDKVVRFPAAGRAVRRTA